MNIGIDFTQAQYLGTGVGNYTFNLVKHLLQLETEHNFTLFGCSLRGLPEFTNLALSLKPHQLKLYPIPPTLLEISFNRFHQPPIEYLAGPVDIFHASDWAQPRSRRAKLVTTIHDLTTIKFPQYHHPKIITAQQRRLLWVSKEASLIIADSNSTKQDIINLLGIKEEKIRVVYLAASTDFSDFAALPQKKKNIAINKIKRRYSLDKYFLSVGTNEPRKNLAKVITAYLSLAQSEVNIPNLVIAGRYGWGESSFKLIPPELSSKIKILGFVSQSDLPALYAASELFIYPSLYEGFGLPVVEAMTLSLPVVTSKRGSLGEIAGSAAVLVDPASVISIKNGIHRALAHAPELKQKSVHQAKHFTWEKTAQETLSVYLHA